MQQTPVTPNLQFQLPAGPPIRVEVVALTMTPPNPRAGTLKAWRQDAV